MEGSAFAKGINGGGSFHQRDQWRGQLSPRGISGGGSFHQRDQWRGVAFTKGINVQYLPGLYVSGCVLWVNLHVAVNSHERLLSKFEFNGQNFWVITLVSMFTRININEQVFCCAP